MSAAKRPAIGRWAFALRHDCFLHNKNTVDHAPDPGNSLHASNCTLPLVIRPNCAIHGNQSIPSQDDWARSVASG
jgi:hypothetical protein